MRKTIKQHVLEGAYTLNPILLLIAFILFSLYVNNVIIKFRLNEFERALTELSNDQIDNNSINLLSRFKLLQSRQKNKGRDDAEIVNEIKFESYREGEVEEESPLTYSTTEKTVLGLIKGVRFIMGKKDDHEVIDNRHGRLIEMASYYERIRKYEKALEIYNRLLDEEDLSPTLRNNILVHRGFCQGLLAQYKNAKLSLDQVIDDPEAQGSGNWRVSKKLHAAIEDLEERAETVLAQETDNLTKGKELFYVGNSQKAVEFLDEYVDSRDVSELARSEGRYFLGRSLEDMGNSQSAVGEYRKVIQHSPQSLWAKKANRRLFVLGKVYEENEQLAAVALENSKVFEDTAFVKSVEDLQQLSEKIKVEEPEGLKAVIDSLDSAFTADDTASQTSLSQSPPREGIYIENLSEILTELTVPDSLVYTADSADNTELALGIEEADTAATDTASVSDSIETSPTEPVRKRDIYRHIANRAAELNRVYAYWRKQGAVLDGELLVKLIVNSRGKVEKASVERYRGKIQHRGFERDILNRMKNWSFRNVPKTLGNITLEIPIIFRETDKAMADR